MSPWLEACIAKYGAILFGIGVGTAAKYGLTLAEGRQLTLRMVLIDALLTGMVAVIASNAVERMGASGNSAAMVAALFAVSSDRVIRMIRTRFLRRVDVEMASDLERIKGQVRQEVQAEMSGRAIIEDTMTGKAPDEYEALKRKHQPGQP